MLDVADIRLETPRTAFQRSSKRSTAIAGRNEHWSSWKNEIIREALRRANGNKSQAARLLGLSRNALRYRLDKIGVPDAPDTKT